MVGIFSNKSAKQCQALVRKQMQLKIIVWRQILYLRHKSIKELDNISRAFEIRFSFRSIYAVVDYANISGLHLDDAAGGGGVGGDRFGPTRERERVGA